MASIDQAIYQFQRTDEETHTRQLARKYQLPYVSLVGYPIAPHVLAMISAQDAATYEVIPYIHLENKLKVAIRDPRPETIDFLQGVSNRLGAEVTMSLCSKSSYDFGLSLYLTIANQQKEQTHIAVTHEKQKRALRAIKSREDMERHLAQAGATEVLDVLFAAGTGMDASDIHLEPQEKDVRVRFRIDGVLQDITFLSPEVHKQIVSRIKFLAHMKLDVIKVNQDGRFTIELADTSLDVRVSTLPSAYGEIVDMRLLRAHAQFISLENLSLSEQSLADIKAAIALPHGMVLVTGPTGSGKTTTLYAVLAHLNQSGVKIVTLEDPIEYRLDGVDQVQITNDQGFSFAEALKGVLRQDPDIIMVGEIRDKETADIGLQAAMTGHLFFSTLHTNNAPASLARMLDMGVEPYKLAGSINLIIAQRLVRKLCTNCHGTGCAVCHKTGYKGRIPIIETLKPSKLLDEAIMRKASVRELYDIATSQGMISMKEDGLAKVRQGLTTESEVNRVTAELIQD